MKVVIYEPAPRDNFWFHVNIKTPHLGAPILAGLARARGHQAWVVSEMLAPIDYSYLDGADVIGISINTGLTHQRAYEIAAEVRQRCPGKPIIGGGHHATMNVSESLQHVDYVMRGYAEGSFVELIEEIHGGSRTPKAAAVSYIDPITGRQADNPAKPGTSIGAAADLDSIVGYRAIIQDKRRKMESYGTFLPLSYWSRGCAFKCHFCSIPLADDPRMAYRTTAEVVDDVRQQLEFYRYPYLLPKVWLIDDNFGQHREPTRVFLRELAEAKLPCNFVVQSRVEIGRDPEILDLMKKAGFTSVYVGVESISNDSLQHMNKRSSTDAVAKAINAIHKAGMMVVALLMFGNDGDRPGVAGTTLDFLKKLKVSHLNPQITVPYPGTEFHRQMKDGGRIFSDAFYDCNKRPVHFPSTLRPSQVVREIREITRRHLTRGQVVRNLILHHDFQALITRKGVVTSGFLDRVLQSVPALEQLEKDYYDANDFLREDLLLRHQDQGVIQERVQAMAN
jgi:radical SAM superfamily enzyme YgiQ (UPF0313 family)